MGNIDRTSFRGEAQECRLKALAYLGRPEAAFLMRVAKAFDELAEAESRFKIRPPQGWD